MSSSSFRRPQAPPPMETNNKSLLPSRSAQGSSLQASTSTPTTTITSSKGPANVTSQGLDVRHAVSSYFDRLLQFVPGMKVILFDPDAKMTFSLVSSQSQILEKSVFLTSSLIKTSATAAAGGGEEKMPHLKCLIIARATEETARAIGHELSSPLYGEYHLFFTTPVSPAYLSRLAEMDAKRALVKQVVELYCDYLPLNADLFDITQDEKRWREKTLTLLLSLRQRPTIRYSQHSSRCEFLAKELVKDMTQYRALFDFGNLAPASNQSGETLLLVLDRKDDPVTPLLIPWTYQAMVHELIGLEFNVLDLGKEWERKNANKLDSTQIVLSQSDDFFVQNMFKDYGALANNTQRMLDEYKHRFTSHKSQLTDNGVEGMSAVLENLPEFKKFASNSIKHGAVVGEITRMLSSFKLIELSTLEQDLACVTDYESHNVHVEKMRTALGEQSSYANDNKLKLVLLYGLKYEQLAQNKLSEFKQLLRTSRVSETQLKVVDTFLQYAKRRPDAGSNSQANAVELLQGFRKNVLNTFTESGRLQQQNALMRHQPFLSKVLDEIRTSKLSDTRFPVVPNGSTNFRPSPNAPYKEVIVLIVGGATYAEACVVGQWNHSGSPLKVLLGGTGMINSKQFLHQLEMV